MTSPATSRTGPHLHAVLAQDDARPDVRLAVQDHPALEADAHAAERGPGLAADGRARGAGPRGEQRGRDGGPRGDAHRPHRTADPPSSPR